MNHQKIIEKFIIFIQLLTTDIVLANDNECSHNNDELLSNSESDVFFKESNLFLVISTIIHDKSDNEMFQYAANSCSSRRIT